VENHVCLSRGVHVAGAAWHTVMRIVLGVGDLGQRTAYGRTGQVLGGRAIERSGGTVAVYTMHMETRNTNFLVEPQNHG
jgi:hypothetical protein